MSAGPGNQVIQSGPITAVSASAASRLLRVLHAPRRFTTLALVSLGIGAAHALTILPVTLVLGAGDFWIFPRGLIQGSQNDMAQVLVGQLVLERGAWGWPLLHAANLGFPAGTNIFWIDAVPIVGLAAKLLAGVVHGPVNLLGFDLLGCLVLPGLAMTWVVWVAGHRHLLAAITASAVADAAPLLLYRWGHIPLMAQYLIIFALGLYLLSLRRPRELRVSLCWVVLLAVTLLTNSYLFAMVGGCWVAALLQRRLSGAASPAGPATEALAVMITMLGLMVVMGIVTLGHRTANLGEISAEGFGSLSTNLGSLLVPQISGVVPGLAHYQIGMGPQYEGFGYVGAGTLLLLFAGLPHAVGSVWAARRRHAALIVVVAGSFLFALSNRIFLGGHLLLAVPLPDAVLRLFGLFRSSGRFVWLPAYAIMAGSIVLALRQKPSLATTVLCLAAATLQIVDAAPLRAAIEAAVSGPVPAVLDRDRVAALAARSRAIEAFPSFGCVYDAIVAGNDPATDWDRLRQANMELQLIAARANLPINSVYNSRLPTDCRAEDAQRRATLRPGTLYLYLDAPTATAAQLDGRTQADVCGKVELLRYCLIPPGTKAATEVVTQAAAQADGAGVQSGTGASP
jgi:hypothetical protein